jgi:hypothetical protein
MDMVVASDPGVWNFSGAWSRAGGEIGKEFQQRS